MFNFRGLRLNFSPTKTSTYRKYITVQRITCPMHTTKTECLPWTSIAGRVMELCYNSSQMSSHVYMKV